MLGAGFGLAGNLKSFGKHLISADLGDRVRVEVGVDVLGSLVEDGLGEGGLAAAAERFEHFLHEPFLAGKTFFVAALLLDVAVAENALQFLAVKGQGHALLIAGVDVGIVVVEGQRDAAQDLADRGDAAHGDCCVGVDAPAAEELGDDFLGKVRGAPRAFAEGVLHVDLHRAVCDVVTFVVVHGDFGDGVAADGEGLHGLRLIV